MDDQTPGAPKRIPALHEEATKTENASALDAESLEAKLERLKLLEAKAKLREGLPHLHGWKWYKWAREFFESREKTTLLVAGNQLSKSSSQIRKCIDWATDKEKWPLLWRTVPRSFVYMYPSLEVALNEFEQKWVPEFMPKNEFKTHPVYGWEFDKKRMMIRFFSGVSVFFKSYEQDKKNLQTLTAHAVFVDEEMPVELYDEIMFRLAAVDGYFSMVFTATLGQDFWRRAMERVGESDEALPQAKKIHASAYDCLEYEDGTKSHWTIERIERLKQNCKSHNEVLKRIFGRFVVDEGLKYPTFDASRHRSKKSPIPPTWEVYAGIDIGSGGDQNHPAAIVFIAVNPEHTRARVFAAWRGDNQVTTAGDVLIKYIEMRQALGVKVTRAFYDWAAKDFAILAARISEPFEMAEKNHEIGEGTLNTLFKNDALTLDSDDLEIDKLAVELSSLRQDVDKRRAKDDLTDATRYGASRIPFDWVKITGSGPEERTVDIPVGGVDELARLGKIPADELDRHYGNLSDDTLRELAEVDASYFH